MSHQQGKYGRLRAASPVLVPLDEVVLDHLGPYGGQPAEFEVIRGDTYRDRSTVVLVLVPREGLHWTVALGVLRLVEPPNHKTEFWFVKTDAPDVTLDRAVAEVLAARRFAYVFVVEDRDLYLQPTDLVDAVEASEEGRPGPDRGRLIRML